jgi:hypothetical protein
MSIIGFYRIEIENYRAKLVYNPKSLNGKGVSEQLKNY